MENKYTSGLINICFMALGVEKATTLMDNQFDILILRDSATGASVELEVTTSDLEQLYLMSIDENDTEQLI